MFTYNGESFYLHDDPFFESYVPKEYDDEFMYNSYTIGTFDIDGPVMEDTIGSFDKPEKITIKVLGNEGDRIPHCHFMNEDKSIDGCVKLENAEYFTHGSGKHPSKLSNKMAKAFYKFMSEPNRKNKNDTNWEAAKFAWNIGDHKVYDIKEILNIPRYDLINKPTYYRYTIDNIGIYEYVRNQVNQAAWSSFLKSNAHTWLPKPSSSDKYRNDKITSWYKKEGKDMFERYTLPKIKNMIPKTAFDRIKVKESSMDDNQIIYSDAYQILIR